LGAPRTTEVVEVIDNRGINMEVGNGTGLGDLVLGCWFPEKYPFFVTNWEKINICKLFGRSIETDLLRCSRMLKAYRYDLTHPKINRLDNWRRALNIAGQCERPEAHIPDSAFETADMLADDDFVMLFPFGKKPCRQWPACHWIDLYFLLIDAGECPLVFIREDTKLLPGIRYHWGFDVFVLAALMKKAKKVFTNDSFPAHLSLTLSRPTVIMAGPTDKKCSPCGFKWPMRQACVAGCDALYDISPEEAVATMF